MTEQMDVRHQASAILSIGKMRQLDEADIAVVKRERLEALEQVWNAAFQMMSSQPVVASPVWSREQADLQRALQRLEMMPDA